jgi:hypothetical protein
LSKILSENYRMFCTAYGIEALSNTIIYRFFKSKEQVMMRGQAHIKLSEIIL